MKSTKEALDRGLKFKQAVRDSKNASSSSKWKPPSIPLTTPVGVADMTLRDLMKKEKLSYADAVTVYLSFQQSLKQPSKKPKKTHKAEEESQQETEPDAVYLAHQQSLKQPSKKPKKTEKAEKESRKDTEPDAPAGANKKSKNKPPADDKSETNASALQAGTKRRKPQAEEPVPAESKNSVAPRAKASKAKAPPALKRLAAFVEEHEPEMDQPPTKRLKAKTRVEPVDRAEPELQKADPELKEADPELDEDEDSALFKDWDELCYEYDLWRQGLPQVSELEADLKAHRAASPIKSEPAAAVPLPGVLALPAPELSAGCQDGSQVSGSTFVDGQARLREVQRITAKDRQDSQTNLSELGPSASQVASAVDMNMLLQRVQQLELEKAELESQLSSDSKASNVKEPAASSDEKPSNVKEPEASQEPQRPVATPVRPKTHVFHDSPTTSPAGGLSTDLLAKVKTQAEPVPKPTLAPDQDPKGDEKCKICSTTHRKEYAKLNRLHESGALAGYPNMLKLQEGTLDEKRALLRDWVLSGQNLQACESTIEIAKEAGVRSEKIWMQIAVKNMHKQKVQHIIATQVGERDEQAPDSLEDTLYWCIVGLTQVESSEFRVKQNLRANCRPGSEFFDGGIPGADPGLLHKKPAASQQAPLKADVLRAFDQRKDELSAIASQVAGSTATTVKGTPLINELFKSPKEKHGKWCREIKKNVNSIADLIFDMGDASDDDSQRLLKDLKTHKQKLEQLAKKPPI
ncbi:unnamed protein product [Symbiodinium sp. CCMP2592]|nr:unnamed protein product [Symbiodinium sp. CCMP2592]